MRLPSNLALLLKTIIITEGLGARLDPDFYLLSVIEPYTNQLLLKLYSPTRLMRKLKRAGLDMAWLGAEAPQQLRRLIGAIERKGFELGMRPESFDPLIKRLERIANRIVLGILAAAFIAGLATLLSVYRPSGWENWVGVMFAVGIFLALGLGVYLAWSVLRSGRDWMNAVSIGEHLNSLNAARGRLQTLASMVTRRALFHKFAFCRIIPAGAEIDMLNAQ